MRYVSTRRRPGDPTKQFCEILLEGLAPDGGLYLPESYPQVDAATLAGWRTILTEQGYAALAHSVLSLFVDDIPAEDLRAICERAYTAAKFGTPEIVPVSRIGARLWLAHLSNGPTAAFKDMAMQLLGELFEYELERRGTTLNILGATSGDTGSAAEHAMLGKPAVRVIMLTPKGRMTPFQQAQMFSLDDPAIVNVSVDGVFDDCQDLVKAVMSDLEFKTRWRIGAVNSINWARLVAQVVYYVASWIRITSRDDERVSFAVPTGNFGNILAAHIAREMGVPIELLILATNENDVLDEFFRKGIYRVRGSAETHETSSPSMDISKASNFERFVFDLLGRDGDRVRALFAGELAEHGIFDLSDVPEFASLTKRFGIVSGSSTHADRVATIRSLHERTGVVIDPHTADGVKLAWDLLAGRLDTAVGAADTPVVVAETALPVKFAATIVEALGVEPTRPAVFEGLEARERHVIELPHDVVALKALIVDRLTRS